MKTLFINVTLASSLMAAAAIAQTTAPTDRPAAPPAPAERQATPPATSTTRSTVTATADWRASKLIGSAVYNQANERIGDINELLLDNSGKVSHVVLGVGGFLGMGEHEVAVPFSDLQMMQDGSTIKITTSFTKQSLQAMPRWTWSATEPARR